MKGFNRDLTLLMAVLVLVLSAPLALAVSNAPSAADLAFVESLSAEPLASTAPPTGTFRALAEYEPMYGIFIGWVDNQAVLTDIALCASTDPNMDSLVFVVCASEDMRQKAEFTLQIAGCDMDRIGILFLHCKRGCFGRLFKIFK